MGRERYCSTVALNSLANAELGAFGEEAPKVVSYSGTQATVKGSVAFLILENQDHFEMEKRCSQAQFWSVGSDMGRRPDPEPCIVGTW